jgi:hypothetical protein
MPQGLVLFYVHREEPALRELRTSTEKCGRCNYSRTRILWQQRESTDLKILM